MQAVQKSEGLHVLDVEEGRCVEFAEEYRQPRVPLPSEFALDGSNRQCSWDEGVEGGLQLGTQAKDVQLDGELSSLTELVGVSAS